MLPSDTKSYFKSHWDEVVVTGLVTIIGAGLIGHSALLMVVLPDQDLNSEKDGYLSVQLGKDGKLYDKDEVLKVLRLVAMVLGCVLILLAWLSPAMHFWRHKHPSNRTFHNHSRA